jgi:spore maturation protein CgeB
MILGNIGGTNIGGSLHRAASELGIEAHIIESKAAMEAPFWLRQLNWRLRGRRPTRLGSFSKELVEKAMAIRPALLLTTGFAPCHKEALWSLKQMGIRTLNYLTDDPFNSSQYAPWFLNALPSYDCVFSPRQANKDDLSRLGCDQVHYLPFAYDPELFFPESPSESERQAYSSDVLFVGGADDDRLPWLAALIREEYNLAIYGDYWQHFPITKPSTRGHAGPEALRKATSAAKVALCLVRRANRDGHVMRSFEIPAVGACMLAEDTPEHRAIFGPDGQTVVYFRTIDEMLSRLRWLLDHNAERERLAHAAHALVVGGRNTYRDRLVTMLETTGLNVGALNVERSNVPTFQRSNVLTQ